MFGETPSTEKYPEVIYADLVRTQDLLVSDVIADIAKLLHRRIARPIYCQFLLGREERRILGYLSKKEDQDRDFVEGMKQQRRTRSIVWHVQDLLKEIATITHTEADFQRVLPALLADWEAGPALRDEFGRLCPRVCTYASERITVLRSSIARRLGDASFGSWATIHLEQTIPVRNERRPRLPTSPNSPPRTTHCETLLPRPTSFSILRCLLMQTSITSRHASRRSLRSPVRAAYRSS